MSALGQHRRFFPSDGRKRRQYTHREKARPS